VEHPNIGDLLMGDETSEPPPILDRQLLNRLEREWRAQGAPLVEHLSDGLSDAEIDRLTEPIGLRLPNEPRAWWRWHNGVPRSVPLRVDREMGAPGFVAWPLDEAVAAYQRKRALVKEMFIDDDEDPDWWWDPAWFPVSLGGRDATLTCDCSRGGDITPILLVDHRNVEGFRHTRARSLGELVTWWIEALENRGWQYNQETNAWDSDPAGLDTSRETTNLI
jgi:cell wall assembly regulator SMI1